MMLTKRVIGLMMLLASGSAYSGDLAGQASIIDGDTLEIHGTRIRLWGVDAPERASFVAARTACSIGAAPRRRTLWMPSLQGGR
jgi:endonuclease YncB( thermonuclease family)